MFPPFSEWDPGPGAKALPLSGPISPALRGVIQLIQKSELGHLNACTHGAQHVVGAWGEVSV